MNKTGAVRIAWVMFFLTGLIWCAALFESAAFDSPSTLSATQEAVVTMKWIIGFPLGFGITSGILFVLDSFVRRRITKYNLWKSTMNDLRHETHELDFG